MHLHSRSVSLLDYKIHRKVVIRNVVPRLAFRQRGLEYHSRSHSALAVHLCVPIQPVCNRISNKRNFETSYIYNPIYKVCHQLLQQLNNSLTIEQL